MNDATKLRTWQKSLDLADFIYEVTSKFPSQERFGLCDQMRRCAVSIGSNIAEGAGRNSQKEFYHFLGISNGSASELQFQTELSYRRNYLSETERAQVMEHLDTIVRMNINLQYSLRKSIDRSNRNSPNHQ
jgi:four helix bundle protein